MKSTTKKQTMLPRIRWALIGTMVVALLAGWTWNHMTPARAAPLNVPEGQIATSSFEIVSAIYEPGTVTITVLPRDVEQEPGIPTLVLSAMVEVEFAIPGRSETVTRKIPSAMTLSVPELEKFPGPMDMYNGDHCFDLFATVDDVDQERGLEQIRRIHETFVKQRAEEPAGDAEQP